MCGIAGGISVLARSPADSAQGAARLKDCVARIGESLRHRGPDGSGLWASANGEVAFAHRRLAIIDLSEAGAQPMVDAQSGCAICFNGEIYNFQELRRDLEALGETFRSSSDTEVVLKAFKHWGLATIPKLRGIFAMALWDPRTREVHLVRDHLGIKPLYWGTVPDGPLGAGTLLFASEVRALLASGAVERRLDPAGIASYLAQGFVVGPSTIVAGVQLLPAASILTIAAGARPQDGNTQSLQCYWQPPASGARRTTEGELREVLADSVRRQLVSDAPLGIFLSGGIDSSAVATLASEVAPGAVHTFTIGFEEAGLDESAFAANVAQALGSRHSNETLRELDFVQHLPEALASIDQPTYDALNTYFVSRAARKAGMTVALAGTGGDELFGGYPTFQELPRMLAAGRWVPSLLNGAIGAAARLHGGMHWKLLGHAPPQTRWGKLADVAVAGHDLVQLYQVSYALFTREAQARLASRPVRDAQRSQDFGLPATVARSWRTRIVGSDIEHSVSLLEMSSFIGERLLRDTDAASMAVGLEVRVPLLDHVLYETVAGIDPARRFQPARKKQLLRDVALARLDPALFDRPKSGFVLPIDRWARRGLQPQMDRVLTSRDIVARAGLDPDTVAMLWRSYVAGKPGLHWSRVWSIYVLLEWCVRHDMRLAA